MTKEEIAVFDDHRNVCEGWGRIIWARASTDVSGRVHPEGWVLPGGRRTTDHVMAVITAKQIDRYTRRQLEAAR